jgi:HK97 family phage major capsid protein
MNYRELLKKALEERDALIANVDNAKTREELDKIELDLRKADLKIADLRAKIAIEEQTNPTDPAARKAPGEGSNGNSGFNPIATYSNGTSNDDRKTDNDNIDYRKAFQQFITKGTPMPAELRDDESTTTTDIATAIPTVLVNRIVEKLESTGMILPLVTKTSFPAGISIPTSSVIPEASWVAEGGSSDRQKKTTSLITFTHYKLRCEISMSMEASKMALSAFEASFERQVVRAMTKAIEKAIIQGAYASDETTLVGPKGILSETPPTGQALTAKNLSYDLLTEAEGALPEEYENGAVWCMTKKTFMSFIGMQDAEGQPIARINYGIGGKPERTLLGRTVVLCGKYMDSFSKNLQAGKIFAFLFNFADYAMNTIYDVGVQKKQDWDTEDMLTKAVMSVDGKVVDKNSLVTITKE